MPQLDVATYRSQVFWLVVVFVGYYGLVAGDILPSIATRRKARAKKLAQSQGDVGAWDEARSSAVATLESVLGGGVVGAGEVREQGVAQGDAFVRGEAARLDAEALATSGPLFLEGRYDASLSRA